MTGLPVEMIRLRLLRGWTPELIMTRPESAGPHSEERKAQIERKASRRVTLAWGAAALMGAFAVVTCIGTSGPQNPCRRSSEAFVMGNTFIERRLRSPSTAEFPSITEAKITPLPRGDNCAFRIVTYVDAQNAFGGTVREHFALEVEPDAPGSDTWKLKEISTF